MGVNLIKKYQNLVISKCGKSRNKNEVSEEIGCGNNARVGKNLAAKKKWALIVSKNMGKKLYDNFRLDRFTIKVNHENEK